MRFPESRRIGISQSKGKDCSRQTEEPRDNNQCKCSVQVTCEDGTSGEGDIVAEEEADRSLEASFVTLQCHIKASGLHPVGDGELLQTGRAMI